MAKITVEEIDNIKIWEEFVLNYSDSNFLQSWNWGEFHQNLGKTIHRNGFYKDKKLIGVMLAIVEKAKRATYVTVPGGPLLDWQDPEVIKLFKETIQKIAKETGSSFVRVRPQIFETEDNAKLFSKLGFKNAPMHLHAELTRQLDLTKSEEELLSEMRKNTRYEVKQAIKQNVQIRISKQIEDLDEFYDLQIQTAKRQGFVPFDKSFLKEQFKVFVTDNEVLLYTAFLGTQKLAEAFIIFYGQEADYHYGASTELGRKYPGTYLIQWEAIKEAKKRGLKKYNFWGVAPEGQTEHRFYGVSIFKRGFGGFDVEYLHARDLIINPLAYKLNWMVEATRKRVRRV